MDDKIRQIIEKEMNTQGLNQSKLAEKIGMTRSAVNQIMTGRRGKIPVTLEAVLNGLGLHLAVVDQNGQEVKW